MRCRWVFSVGVVDCRGRISADLPTKKRVEVRFFDEPRHIHTRHEWERGGSDSFFFFFPLPAVKVY